MTHIIDEDLIDDAKSLIAPPTEAPPAIWLKRPTPVEKLPRWGVRPVASRSRNPLEASF